MGYAATIIVAYGVRINHNQMNKLFELVKSKGLYKNYELTLVPKKDITVTRKRRVTRHLHTAHCYSDGTDSRVDALEFNDEFEGTHVFGILCASRGYAYSDNIEEAIANIPQRAKDNFNDYCAPLLKEIGIEEKPSIKLISQVW
jgi:hypothetical protein